MDGNDSNMESNSIMVPGGENQSLETLSCFVENAPWRKLIARKQKWACTFGKAYLKYEISRAPSKKNQQMTKFSFCHYELVEKRSIHKVHFFLKSFPRRQDTRSSLGLFYFRNRSLMLELPALLSRSYTIPMDGEEDRTEAGKQRSHGESKWDYLTIQKKAKMGAKST